MADKSKEKIRDALLFLLESNVFHEITVAEICANCCIARGTFYNHFSSKEEVISWTSRNFLNDCLDKFITISHLWIDDLVYRFFELSYHHRDYLDLLAKRGIFTLHVNELFFIFQNHEKVTSQKLYLDLSEHMRPYAIRAYTASALAMYEQWSATNFDLSIQELTDLYLEIVHNPEQP